MFVGFDSCRRAKTLVQREGGLVDHIEGSGRAKRQLPEEQGLRLQGHRVERASLSASGTTKSSVPSMAVPITGRPAAIASNTALGIPSQSDAKNEDIGCLEQPWDIVKLAKPMQLFLANRAHWQSVPAARSDQDHLRRGKVPVGILSNDSPGCFKRSGSPF